jgi:hypothetical protein
MPRTKTAQKTLPEILKRNINFYSTAATAAGVSMLALAQPAAGEVVITKKTIPIPVSNYFEGQIPVLLDLNHDGATDLSFILSTFAYHSFNAVLEAVPAQGAGVIGGIGTLGRFYGSALLRGARIGPSAHFSSKAADLERSEGFDVSSRSSRHVYGKWDSNSPNRYLGVKFLIDGKTHYGWVRLTVNTTGKITGTITAYAYETVPNKKILAGISENPGSAAQAETVREKLGQPSLGMLALGSDGLAIWRRETFYKNRG